jgi:hypothetical protein
MTADRTSAALKVTPPTSNGIKLPCDKSPRITQIGPHPLDEQYSTLQRLEGSAVKVGELYDATRGAAFRRAAPQVGCFDTLTGRQCPQRRGDPGRRATRGGYNSRPTTLKSSGVSGDSAAADRVGDMVVREPPGSGSPLRSIIRTVASSSTPRRQIGPSVQSQIQSQDTPLRGYARLRRATEAPGHSHIVPHLASTNWPPGFPDTEEVTGSIPVPPTSSTRHNA